MGHHLIAKSARSRNSIQVYHPVATVKCEGPRAFRSQAARDLGCLLDVNPSIKSWVCMPTSLDLSHTQHVPDFAVFDADGRCSFFDAPDRVGSFDPASAAVAALNANRGYRLFGYDEVYDGTQLRNAKDLLRYGGHVTPLGDRVRLLAALDEQGSLTFAEALQLFSESNAVAGLASMILREMVEIDLDEALIGPETVVRRIRA
jgi:hypothetical protein